MEYTLVDGDSAPDKGAAVRVRVLRKENSDLAVDRPNRDRSLKLRGESEITVPPATGTYEVRGQVRRVMLAERDGADFLFLKDHHVKHISNEIKQLPRYPSGPDWESTDAGGVDLDIDPSSLVPEESVTEQSESRPSADVGDQQRESLNELLLNTR
jgi:hypothetical protein